MLWRRTNVGRIWTNNARSDPIYFVSIGCYFSSFNAIPKANNWNPFKNPRSPIKRLQPCALKLRNSENYLIKSSPRALPRQQLDICAPINLNNIIRLGLYFEHCLLFEIVGTFISTLTIVWSLSTQNCCLGDWIWD